ncbi:porin [Variovorax rhizosphaerae]|uniref:Porin n=1 Tax=Variovorax rhizosphaerae TaxID=1836200 RepID=A0ABU8WXX1_9BURK
MRAPSLALGAAAALCAAMPAAAQSSVTVFGVVDLAVQHLRGDGHLTRLESGALNGSRFGFKGQEDLGGGLAASFHLEAGINADTGRGRPNSINNVVETPGDFISFNRRSTVGLIGRFGEVRAGRDYTPVADNHTDFDVFGNSGNADSSLLTQALAIGLVAGRGVRTDVRASNAVVYVLPPDLGGFWGYGMYAIGENNNEPLPGFRGRDGGHRGARLGWEGAGLNVALAYGKSILASQDNLENVHLGGTYTWNDLQFFGQLSRERTTIDGVRHTNDAGALGLRYTIGVQAIKAQVVTSRIKRAGMESLGATAYALGYEYNLSLRTALYGAVVYVHNNARGTFDLGVPVAPGSSASGVQAGMRHSF